MAQTKPTVCELLLITAASPPDTIGPVVTLLPVKIYLRKDGFWSPGVYYERLYALLKLDEVDLSTDSDHVKGQVLARFKRIGDIYKKLKKNSNGSKADSVLFGAHIKVLQQLRGDKQLPRNWVMGFDPSQPAWSTTGIYFYNIESDVATWEFPIPLESELIAFYDTKLHELQSTKLPKDWAEQTNVTNGRVYYHNTVTGEYTWHRPLGNAFRLPPGWSKVNDGYAYSFTGEARKSAPFLLAPERAAALKLRATKTKELATRCKDTAVKTAHLAHASFFQKLARLAGKWLSDEEVAWMQTSLYLIKGYNAARRQMYADRLPEGWTSMVDPSSGGTYYVNTVTNQSQVRPCASSGWPPFSHTTLCTVSGNPLARPQRRRQSTSFRRGGLRLLTTLVATRTTSMQPLGKCSGKSLSQ